MSDKVVLTAKLVVLGSNGVEATITPEPVEFEDGVTAAIDAFTEWSNSGFWPLLPNQEKVMSVVMEVKQA